MLGLAPPPPLPSSYGPACPLCRPPYSSCRTPQSKRELLGVRYAVQGVDGYESTDELAPLEQPQGLPLQELSPPANPQVAPLDEFAPLDKPVLPEKPQGAPLNKLVNPGHPQVCSNVGPKPHSSVYTGLRYTYSFLIAVASAIVLRLHLPALPTPTVWYPAHLVSWHVHQIMR